MHWNIANAKQQFSEVVRLAAQAPQPIYNRDKAVAVLISAQDFEDFRQWQTQHAKPTLAQGLQRMVGFRNIAVHDDKALQLPITVAIIEKHLDEFLDYSKALLQGAAF